MLVVEQEKTEPTENEPQSHRATEKTESWAPSSRSAFPVPLPVTIGVGWNAKTQGREDAKRRSPDDIALVVVLVIVIEDLKAEDEDENENEAEEDEEAEVEDE